jgi:hypothetical protein
MSASNPPADYLEQLKREFNETPEYAGYDADGARDYFQEYLVGRLYAAEDRAACASAKSLICRLTLGAIAYDESLVCCCGLSSDTDGALCSKCLALLALSKVKD